MGGEKKYASKVKEKERKGSKKTGSREGRCMREKRKQGEGMKAEGPLS